MEERQDFMIEKGLHQAVVFKLSHGAPDLKEETTLAVVWISLPNLSPDFLQRSLYCLASAVGKPIAIDKTTQIKSRPSTTRVKVILDLMEKLPNRIRLQFVDGKSGKLIEVFQEYMIIYLCIAIIVSPPTLNRKLSPEAPVFVPKCVIAKKNESRALLSNPIDLGEDSLDEDEEDNMLDLGENSLDEDKEDMLDICFDRVSREGDISPRQQRSGSNKSKKKDTWKAT
ncbi:hypothetical protein H5410_016116 [Solanum commersonii]|uniref:DUF4283 domain-containing protein n=1 Tax=Solanum commersonii TaxID=4109 RepID=A0A9J5ZWD4_SOLCO|nr:hypothetical protein H5410_016116 [Solanum commersonii]